MSAVFRNLARVGRVTREGQKKEAMVLTGMLLKVQ